MIYVTGDTHASNNIAKLRPSRWRKGQTLTRDDYLIICGDFGAFWGPLENDRKILSWHESNPWTTLWLDGNHENHDMIDDLPVCERFGGSVHIHPDFPHLIHLMRGEVYDLPTSAGETVRAFVMGGAPSIDRLWRIEGISWWAREMPSDEEYAHAERSLERVGWSVDYVFTHDLPRRAIPDALAADKSYDARYGVATSEIDDFLQRVDDRLDKDRLRMWYAGHYHVDTKVMDDKHCVLFNSVVRLGDVPRTR